MKALRMKSVQLALAAALAAGNAHAVHVSANGTGQVLLFPYYSARNGYITQLAVSNTQDNTKVLKLRFREGMGGKGVMELNIFLAPQDTWTGAVIGTAQGARLVSNDNSCVAPSDIFTEGRSTSSGTLLNDFYNYGYSGSFASNGGNVSLDRTREGYFEVFEMGVIDPSLSGTAAQLVDFANPSGPKTNCGALDNYDSFAGNLFTVQFPNKGANLLAPPRGGIAGRASLINSGLGVNYSFNATALDAWSSQVAYFSATDSRPVLSDANPASSSVTTPAGVVIARWNNGRDAVTAALMRSAINGEYVMDAGSVSQTDWVVTLPNRDIYQSTSSTTNNPFAPQSLNCDDYEYKVVGRDAATPAGPVIGTPPPGLVTNSCLKQFSNVVPFNTSTQPADEAAEVLAQTVLGSRLVSPLDYRAKDAVLNTTTQPGRYTSPGLRSTQGPNGKLTMQFNKAQQKLTPLSAVLMLPNGSATTITGVHYGLPVLGLMLHNYKNASVASRYGGAIDLYYSVRIE